MITIHTEPGTGHALVLRELITMNGGSRAEIRGAVHGSGLRVPDELAYQWLARRYAPPLPKPVVVEKVVEKIVEVEPPKRKPGRPRKKAEPEPAVNVEDPFTDTASANNEGAE